MVSFRTSHACRIYDSSNQSIANTTFTALTFDSESFDDDGMHDLVTNTDRITVVQDGLYLLGGSAQFAANATGQRLLELYLNSTTPIQYGFQWGGSTKLPIVEVSGIYAFSAGDYIQLRAYQDSGGALNVVANGVYSPLFWAARL